MISPPNSGRPRARRPANASAPRTPRQESTASTAARSSEHEILQSGDTFGPSESERSVAVAVGVVAESGEAAIHS